MALYTNTVRTTFANLATTLTGLTENSNILITDVANVKFETADSSGTLGYIIRNKGSYLIDLSPTDFSSLTVADMASAFYGCAHLAAIGNLPTGVTSGYRMFCNCESLTTIPSSFGSTWTALTDGSEMFFGCTSLTVIPSDFGSKWTKLTNGSSMFSSCTSLKTIPSDFGSTWTAMTNGIEMFSSCTSLTTIPSNFGSGCTAMTNGSQMFYGCTSLTTIPSDFGSTWTALTYGSEMFGYCTSLTTIPSDFGSKWTALTYGSGMFNSCTSLKTAYFLAPSCTYTDGLLDNCSNLESITVTAAAYTTLIDALASYVQDGCNNRTYYGLSSTQIDNAKLYSESPTVWVVVHKSNKGLSKYFFAI